MGWVNAIKAKKITADTSSVKPCKYNLDLIDCGNAPANIKLLHHLLGPNIDHGQKCHVHRMRSNALGVLLIVMTSENRIHISR